MRWLSAVRLDARGMRRLLGSLEAEIMAALWLSGERTGPELHAAMGQRVALNTVQTVLTRLADKGLVARTGTRRNYRFRPTVSREELIAAATRELAQGLVADFGSLAAAAFTEVVRSAPPSAADEGRPAGGARADGAH